MRRIAIIGVVLVCALAVFAEDMTFMTNRRQWEKLPTATLMQMGNDFMNVKELPDSGMLCYSLIANRYNENLKGEELKCCIRATCYLGTIHRTYFNNQPEAYKQILKAKDLAEKHHYDEFVINILMELGNLNWRQNGLLHDTNLAKEATDYHKAAFWKAVETHSYRILPVVMTNLNFVAYSRRDFTISAKERATYKSLHLPDTTDLKPIADPITEGVELLDQGKYQQALDIFRNATVERLNTGPKNKAFLQVMLYEYIYYTQLKLGRTADALNTLKQTQRLIRDECPEFVADIYGQYAEFYRLQGNQDMANEYELMSWRSSDSIAQASQANSVDKAGFLYELDKMNEEQKALTLKQQHDRQMLWVVSGFLALALGLIVLLVINRGVIKQKNKALYASNVALLAAEQRRRLAEQEEKARIDAEAAKYGTIRMDEQSTEELWQNIIHVMEYSQEIFDENFSVARLAELIGAKPNYVSQAINQQPDWTFPTLLAHYRIREACRRMNDTARYGNYTVEGLGQSVGFTSRSYFVKLFKKHTGLTPSDYMKQSRTGTLSNEVKPT